jgi:hypothetical protein
MKTKQNASNKNSKHTTKAQNEHRMTKCFIVSGWTRQDLEDIGYAAADVNDATMTAFTDRLARFYENDDSEMVAEALDCAGIQKRQTNNPTE